jgi:hypothetical protein
VKYPVNSDHPSSASCEPSPSPCTDFASSRHLQSYWHWAAVASPTMRLLTSAPTTEAPHAFHHQLEHCHCLFITPVSAELQLPRLNNSSYRATAASSHRSLLNQPCSPSDGPLNSRPSLVLYLSSTSPTNSHHNLYLLSIKPLAILASTIFPSGSSVTTLSPP